MSSSTASAPAAATTAGTVHSAGDLPSPYRGVLLPAWTLAVRELVRFFRQRTRIIGALGQPVMFWLLFGAGLRGSFAPPDWAPETMTYGEFFFPGIAVLIVLFTAIFSTISIIEDRSEGFLQGVLVAPVPRLSIVLGKIGGGAALAAIQAGLFVLVGPLLNLVGLAPEVPLPSSVGTVLWSVTFLILLAFALTALGYAIAWPMESTQGYHAVMSIFLLPMWLLSGAFFPVGEGWLRWIMLANPLSYGVAGLRRAMYPAGTFESAAAAGMPSMGICLSVTVLFAAACVATSVYLTNRRTSVDRS